MAAIIRMNFSSLRTLSVLLFMAVSTVANAQDFSARIGFGDAYIGGSVRSHGKNSVFAGVSYNLKLKSEHWRFIPGVMITTGGDKIGGDYMVNNEKKDALYKISTVGVEIPLLIEYRGRLYKDLKISIGTGPSIYYGLSAKTKGVADNQTYNFSQNLYTGKEELNGQGGLSKNMRYIPKLNPFDFGFTTEMALHYNRYSLGFRARMGLSQIYSEKMSINSIGDFLGAFSSLLGFGNGNQFAHFFIGVDF